jgi:phage terminase large subunit GpA-like protein
MYEIMEAFTDPKVETIVLMFGAQLAKTELILNAIGYFADLDPCPMMMVQPTVEMAEAVSKDRVEPLFYESPALRDLLGEAKAKKSSQTILYKSFPGGQLTMVGANAPAALASRPIRVVMCDETDRFPVSAGEEGDPIQLAIKRTATFPNTKKIILTSTPTVKGVSRIEKAYNGSDKRIREVRCPHCNEFHEMSISNIKCEPADDWEAAVYACPKCGVTWDEADRLHAMDHGRWVATAEFKGIAGFKLSGLNSPWYTIKGIQKELIEARNDPALYRVFVNTVLGEPHMDETDAIEESMLMARREPLGLEKIPKDVLAMTAGIDVQQDRAEITSIGWSETQSYVLDHTVIYGDPTGSDLWKNVDDFIRTKHKHALGGRIGYDAVGVDSGNWSQEVYNFCSTKNGRGVYAVKGVPGPRPIWMASRTTLKTGGRLFLVGTDTSKADLFHRFRLGDSTAPSYVHWHDAMDLPYFEQVLSEYRDLKFQNGVPKYIWTRKPGRRAEALDCLVYGFAVRQSFKPNWEDRRKRLKVNGGSTLDFSALGQMMN